MGFEFQVVDEGWYRFSNNTRPQDGECDPDGFALDKNGRYTPSVEKHKRTQEDKDKEKAKPGTKELAAGRDEVNRKDHTDGSPLNPQWPPPSRPPATHEY